MRIRRVCLQVAVLVLLSAGLAAVPAQAKDDPGKNKEIARRAWEGIINGGDLKLADQLYAADYVYHTDPSVKGPAGVQQQVAMYRAAFPDLRVTIEDLLAEGDKVVVRFRATGTHKGDLMGLAPTGKTFTMTGISIVRIAGGKITEEWEIFDQYAMMQQLGAIPQETTGK